MSGEARENRSERADEIFAGMWERLGKPYVEASPVTSPFAEVLEDVAREWFRRGYSRGGQDGAGLMARDLIQSIGRTHRVQGDEQKKDGSSE